jgi:hypothetical protein
MRKWNVMALFLLLAGCASDQDPSAPSPVVPSPTPAPAPTPTPVASSPYAGSWVYRTTLLAVDRNCGHTPADIGATEGPFAVTVASNGTFTLPNGSQGAINSAGYVSLTLTPGGAYSERRREEMDAIPPVISSSCQERWAKLAERVGFEPTIPLPV